jgi:diguanylate cyclase (GGDEF)-like protein
MKCRYSTAASHCLRVALTCSTWAWRMGLPTSVRDAVEVAALLHDVGMIALPDQILQKPGPLAAEEIRLVEESRRKSVEILAGACADSSILDIVAHVATWYDGTRPGYRVQGEEIPFGARMIAIVEAYDSMTTDHVFRRAMTQERATQELFAFAGRQFDPDMVAQFAEWCAIDQGHVRRTVARQWLQSLDPSLANSFWGAPATPGSENSPDRVFFESRLLDNMHDGVVFVDALMQITQWNHGAERLTGIPASGLPDRCWSPELLTMQDEKGSPLTDADCPLREAVHSGIQSLRRLRIAGRSGRSMTVDCHTIPVTTHDTTTLGAVMLLHDASSETSLEQRCQSLVEKATLDPLTQVANRAEFDRVHEMFVNAHRQLSVPCSLTICDLDHFKRINDQFGHQAGDEVIKTLASLLRHSCRPGDFAARYGGEEFVMLCADSNANAAARRAEHLRIALGRAAIPQLKERRVTASFGVTEIQPGDTPATMLRRADRALLLAKERGRNAVVQLGVGFDDEPDTPVPVEKVASTLVLRRELVTPVPLAVAIEKLRGFVADHRARILDVEDTSVRMEIADVQAASGRRACDRPVTFLMRLDLFDEASSDDEAPSVDEAPSREKAAPASRAVTRTRVRVEIAPHRTRDRRQDDIAQMAQHLLLSLRSYLMAVDEGRPRTEGFLRRTARALAPWLIKGD